MSDRPTIEQIKAFLDMPYWLDGVSSKERYFRTHDDNDGEIGYGLSVAFSQDGDAWIDTTTPRSSSCRFRTGIGGGRSLRVRAALLILALAIDMENQDNPIRDHEALGAESAERHDKRFEQAMRDEDTARLVRDRGIHAALEGGAS